ncbi:MAG TPA: hypothetical protein VHA12_02650 [Candidatus Nanoarchaeia archaeon]|nr:hypothetical protein [Candidatus Nanoarchaeia archaeon]
MDKKDKLNWLGIVFLILWILTFFEEYPYFGSFNFLWFCKISFFLLAMACFTKDSRYLLTFLAVGIIPEIIWMTDFILQIYNINFVGSTSFMFEYGENIFQFILNLFHLFLLPSALIISRYVKFNKSASKQIIFFGFIVATLGYFLSDLNVDINCVHNLCYPLPLGLESYSLLIVFAYLIVCALVIEPIIRKNILKINKKALTAIVAILILIGLLGIVMGLIKYSQVPHYSCVSNDRIICQRFFMDRVQDLPYLTFKTLGKFDSCTIEWKINNESMVRYWTDSQKKIDSIYLPAFAEGKRIISSEVLCFN